MADANSGRGRTMDLNAYWHLDSLPQLGSHESSVFTTLHGDDHREDSADLLQNAETTPPVPVQQQWSETNWGASDHASLYSGISFEDDDLVFIDSVDARESENALSDNDKSSQHPKVQLEITKDGEKIPNENFECNICFGNAKEPVVTSCGHLFCWPCLYQWLYIHSCTKECPVCKGLVTDSNITPIYGRGANDSGCEKKDDEKSSSDLKLPPRPHGAIIEGTRQRMQTSRTMNGGSLNEMPTGIHNESCIDRGQGIHHVVRRLRLRTEYFAQEWLPNRGPRRRLTNMESAQDQETRRQSPNTENTEEQISDGGSRLGSFVRERVDFWQQSALNHLRGYDRLSSISANVERIISRLARETSNNSPFGTVAIPVNVEEPPHSGRHADIPADRPGSIDSVIGVLEGNGLGENQFELNSTANSLAAKRLLSEASGSSDMHGDVGCGRKKWRLN